MSKQSSLVCVVCILVVLLLAGDHQLVAAQIGDEFLYQDPIQAPSILMPNRATGRDQLNSSRDPPAALTPQEDVIIIGEEEAFSGDEYEEALFVGGESARDPERSADEEEDEENLLLAGSEGVVAEVSNNSEEHGSSFECPECGKHFRSDKSMFGHLRSHPDRRDRGYKGSTPQEKLKLLPSRHDAASLPPPAVRPVARYSQRDPNLNAFEILAAYVMLTLKTRGNPPAHDQSVNVKRESDAVPPKKEGSVMSKAADDVTLEGKNGSSVAKKVGDDTVRHKEHGSSFIEMAGGDDTVHRSEHGSSAAEMVGDDHRLLRSEQSIIEEVPKKRGRMKKSKEAAHKKEKDAPSASKARRPYICKHCNAVFPTHQALGGHMAAHNKDMRVQAQHEQATAAWEAHHQGQSSLNRQEPKGRGGEEERGRGGLSASARALLMERYTRLFNSGWQSRQENGGDYKRQHTGREDAGSFPPVAAPVADGDRRRLFGVDLNAPGQE